MPSWKRKVLLAKVETTYGVDAAPAGATDAILAKKVELTPMEGQDISREIETPTFGAQPTITAALHQKLSFEVDLVSSGSPGVAPAWGPLLRCCGLAQVIVAATSVTYNPVSGGFESLTIQLNIDGQRFRILGSRGTCALALSAQGLPVLRFSFWGLYAAPIDAAAPVAALAAQIDRVPRPGTTANTPVFTLDGVSLPLKDFELDMGVQVEPRLIIRAESILITGREEAVKATVQAPDLLSVFDPFARAVSGAPFAGVLAHDVGVGNVITLSMPRLQMKRPTGLSQSQNIVEWPLAMTPLFGNAGNDQFTLALT